MRATTRNAPHGAQGHHPMGGDILAAAWALLAAVLLVTSLLTASAIAGGRQGDRAKVNGARTIGAAPTSGPPIPLPAAPRAPVR